MKKVIGVLFTILAISLTSCLKTVDEVAKQDDNQAKILNYMTTNGLAPTKDTIGAYMILKQANPYGKKASVGNVVDMRLVLYTLDGKLISQTESGKTDSYIFGINSGVIAGLELGVNWLREGESATMLLPYYWAFGSQGGNGVGEYAPIRLELEIISVKTEEDQINAYIASKNYTNVETLTNGVRVVRLNEVTEGDVIGVGKNVVVEYKGLLLSDNKFDEGNLTFKTGVGNNNMITGFDLGIQTLRTSEKAVLIFPSSLGYGTNGITQNNAWIIPPYAPLAFEVNIIAAQ